MILNSKKLGQGKPLIIMHGLFGMLDNWMSVANQLQDQYTLYLLDLRNHGKSPHTEDFNYAVMAEDVRAFMDQEGILSAYVLGHSMGGKVAMTLAQKYPDYVEKLVVVDIAPKYYPTVQDVVLDALLAVNFQIQKSRKEVESVLRQYLQEEDVIQFLMKNMYWKEEGVLAWKFNLPAISKHISNIGQATDAHRFEKPTLFVRGALSNYIKPEDEQDIHTLFTHVQIQTIPDCGHWVHAEKPNEFIQILTRFLRE